MTTPAAFQRLFAHMEWADCQVWKEVLALPSANSDAFVRESLFHIHLVQFAYLTGWTGGTPQPALKDEFGSLTELRSWGQTYYPKAEAFLATLTEEAIGRKDDVLWPDLVERAIGQRPVRIMLGDMLYQVVAHSSHHRAQLNRRLREIGGAPPFVDYVAWAWLGEPKAEWTGGQA